MSFEDSTPEMRRTAGSGDRHPVAVGSVAAVARRQIRVVERTIQRLQELQGRLPVPGTEELAEIRSGERLATQPVVLLGALQVAILDLENAASDLELYLNDLDKAPVLKLPDRFHNAIQAAREALERKLVG